MLAPGVFSRNKFYDLHDTPGARRLDDGRVLLRYRVQDLAFQHTTALTPLEAAVLRYALHLAGQGSIESAQRERVQEALARLAPEVDLNRERPSFLPASRPPTVESWLARALTYRRVCSSVAP